jgi:hypothetical protein
MPLTAAERTARARLGAYAQQARHDTRETTAAARTAFLARFLDEVDPDRVLSDDERARRAEAAKKAYFARLTLARLRSRRTRGKKKTAEDQSAVCVLEEGADASGETPD